MAMYSPPIIRSCLSENYKRIRQLRCYHVLSSTIIVVYILASSIIIKGENVISDDHVTEHYEVMEFEHLTGINGSKLHEQDYHVLKIHLRNESSFIMHVSKPDIFFSSDEKLNHEMEQLHCVYSGSITDPGGKAVGMAALSSCDHEDAFEGLININGEHFQVAPMQDPQRIKRAASKKGSSSKYKATSTPKLSTGNVRRSDSIKVPPKELAKARKQMWKDQEALEDEDDESDDSDESDSDANNEDDDGQLQALLDLEDSDSLGEFETTDDNNSLQGLETEYTIPKQSVAFRRKRKGFRTGTRKPTKVIELALYTDPSLYKAWQAKYPAKAEAKIKEYLLQVVNNMNYVYKQPSLQLKVSFRLVYVGIQKTTPSGLSPTTASSNYLDSFCKFQGKKDSDGALWDHGTMITALNLVDDVGSDGTIGLAYTGTMCLRYYSCSVIQYTKGFETAFTATHEIGHSLGMYHDGEEMNKNCQPSNFIMAAVAGPAQINWSKCSVANLRNFLSSGDPTPGRSDSTAVPRCINKRGRKKGQINYRRGARFPGKKFPVKAQCLTVCKGCSPVASNASPYNNICQMLYCQSPTGGIVPAHPALEGTSCGGGKRLCRNGKCQ